MKINYLLSIKRTFNWRIYLISLAIFISITICLSFNFITIESPKKTVITTSILNTDKSTNITTNNTTIDKSDSIFNEITQTGTITQINGNIIYNVSIKEKNSSHPQVNSSSPRISPPFQEINDGNDGNGSRTTANEYIQR